MFGTNDLILALGAGTALFLVVLLAARGLSGTDHVDGTKEES